MPELMLGIRSVFEVGTSRSSGELRYFANVPFTGQVPSSVSTVAGSSRDRRYFTFSPQARSWTLACWYSGSVPNLSTLRTSSLR